MVVSRAFGTKPCSPPHWHARSSGTPDAVMGAILANASLAAMDIADAAGGPTVAPLLAELEVSAQRAAALYAQLQRFSA